MLHFYTTWIRQKTKDFLTLEGDIEMQHLTVFIYTLPKRNFRDLFHNGSFWYYQAKIVLYLNCCI